MRIVNQIAILFTLALCSYSVSAQQVDTICRVSIPQTEIRYINSSIVGDEFEISIAFPLDYSADTTYPVLYTTGANVFFAASTQIMRILQRHNELPQILLVGIGYRTDSLAKWGELRSRDLTPTAIPDTTKNRWRTGGAALFLRFVKEELMPFIKKNYPASADASFFGYSYGGLFGLYTLFHAPETFQRYIIGSPPIQYDSLVILRDEEHYASKHTDLPARVFMSVGELEEKAGSKNKMVTNMNLLADRLLKRHYPSFHLETIVFGGETHASGPSIAISRGLRVIYRK